MIWFPKDGPLGPSGRSWPRGAWKSLPGMPHLSELLQSWTHPGVSFSSKSGIELSLPIDPKLQRTQKHPTLSGRPSSAQATGAESLLCSIQGPVEKLQHCLAIPSFSTVFESVHLGNHCHHQDTEISIPPKASLLPFSSTSLRKPLIYFPSL